MGYFDTTTNRYRDLAYAHGITLAQVKSNLSTIGEQHGLPVRVDANWYYYHSTSALTSDDLFVLKPYQGPGRLLIAPGSCFDLSIAITFATANNAVLATAPTNSFALLDRSYWEATADWTGGSSSAIGISLGQAPANTAGDVLGGASGDVAATLVAASGRLLGTIGAKVTSGILLKGTNTAIFNRITSAFTAGTGNFHLVGQMLANPGA